jgi:hypothetical protein
MLIGISRTLLAGPSNFISWIVLFNAAQNLGGLAGSAIFGTLQVIREKVHSHYLVEQLVLSNPIVADRLAQGSRQSGGIILDPVLRSAQSTALLARQATREANVLAYNDIFFVIGCLTCLMFAWAVSIEIRMKLRGEASPVALLVRQLTAKPAKQ